MKTIERDGKVYEVGKSYITNTGEIAILHSDDASSDGFIVKYPGGGVSSLFSCRKLSVNPDWTTGTIKQAPVKLIDGDPYMFDYKRADRSRISENILAYYKKAGECFAFNGESWATDRCVNIVRLVPEEK